MKRYGLPKRERLHLREEINRLFASDRRAFVIYPFRVLRLRTAPSDASVKVLISVPKRRIRHAVDRNTIKRRTREAWRQEVEPLRILAAEQGGTLLVALLYIGDRVASSARIRPAVAKAIARLGDELSASDQPLSES